MKNQKKKIIIAAVILIALCVGGFFLYKAMAPDTTAGEKNITVTVVHGDGEEKEFSYDTDKEFLGEVLIEERLVEGENGEFGLFITAVDGETADSAKQQWWAITQGGEQVNTGADETPIEDRDKFELTLKTGY